MNDFYVYAWLRPCGAPFYIGKGRGRRSYDRRRNNLFDKIVRKIEREGGKPIVTRISDGLAEDEAFELERVLIRRYGRRDNGTGILANLTDGGDGVSGWIPSVETRAKISAANKGKSKNIGFKHSLESRAKMSESRTGRKHSKDTIMKLSARMMGNGYSRGSKHTLGARAKMSAARAGVPKTSEHKSAISFSHHMSGPRSDNKSGFKGVSAHSNGGWRARINIGRSIREIGKFSKPEDAARAYDGAAIDAWGIGNCYLNFPEEHTN